MHGHDKMPTEWDMFLNGLAEWFPFAAIAGPVLFVAGLLAGVGWLFSDPGLYLCAGVWVVLLSPVLLAVWMEL